MNQPLQQTSVFRTLAARERPSRLKASGSVIYTMHISTPLGNMLACTDDTGICLLDYAEQTSSTTLLDDLRERLQATVVPESHRYLEQVRIELQEYFAGQRQNFDVPLHTPGTPFRESVWQILQTIPYGQTRSYKEQAIALKRPDAVRAVAAANGQNRINIIIPCHRVIGSNGRLTGYRGGLDKKQWLLDFEQRNSAN